MSLAMISRAHGLVVAALAIAALAGIGFVVGGVAVRASQDAPKPARSTWDGIYTKEQAARGEEIYLQHCAMCHGESLLGDPTIGAANLVGDFRQGWDARPLARLFTKINRDMPGDSPGSLSRQQTADVLSYLLQKNNFPAGQQGLDPESDALSQITFEATRSRAK